HFFAWVASVSLANEDDYDMKDLFSHYKDKIGEETNLDSLGKILLEMGEYDKAAKYYEQYLNESQIAMADSLCGLGTADLRNGNYDEALNSLRKALELREKLYSYNHPDVAQCYMRIGLVYNCMKDYDTALNYYSKTLDIQQKTLPVNHSDFAKTYGNIALSHVGKCEYELALRYYAKASENQEINLPASHHHIAMMSDNIGVVYENMCDYQKAMEYYEKAHQIFRKTLPPSHEFTKTAEDNIRRLKLEKKLN
ncbi:unnamed protein product, partial [Didymodactylos carnosus]